MVLPIVLMVVAGLCVAGTMFRVSEKE